jgi:hypothetical protein
MAAWRGNTKTHQFYDLLTSGEVGETSLRVGRVTKPYIYISLVRKYSYQFGLGYPTIEPLIDWSSFRNPTQLSYNFALQNIRKK